MGVVLQDGYASDGVKCLPCPRGFTCDRFGVVACAGECGPGESPDCDSGGGGFVQCLPGACALPGWPTLVQAGPFLRSDGVCAPYFACASGYYQAFDGPKTSRCLPCAGALPAFGMWVTPGLAFNDASSCLWECNRTVSVLSANGSTCLAVARPAGVPSNQAGHYGAGVQTTCPAGTTSEAGTAMVVGDCVACPGAPGLAYYLDDPYCRWACSAGVGVGAACVVGPDCTMAGTIKTGSGCVSAPFPWQPAGSERLGVVSQAVGLGVAGLGVAGLGVAGMPGGLCSAALGFAGDGRAYTFGAVCNQTFLVWLAGNRSGVLIGQAVGGWRDGFRTDALFQSELYVAYSGATGTLFVLDRANCLLREVAIPAVGDYRTRVYTVYGRTDRFGVDGAPRCYGLLSLASPRLFMPALVGLGGEAGKYWLFVDDSGVRQLVASTREVLLAVPLARGVPDQVTWLDAPNASVVRVGLGDGTGLAFSAVAGRCVGGSTSLFGGACTLPCAWRDGAGRYLNYVDSGTGACVACTSPVCGLGYGARQCTPTGPGGCEACPVLAAGWTYTVPGDCGVGTLRRLGPCLAGSYQEGAWCQPCPPYTTTVLGGAVRVEQCKCWAGFERLDGRCTAVLDGPAGQACAAGVCVVPGHASLVAGGRACEWACDAGYYRASAGGFQDACQACVGLPTGLYYFATSGDTDSPWSCEFAYSGP